MLSKVSSAWKRVTGIERAIPALLSSEEQQRVEQTVEGRRGEGSRFSDACAVGHGRSAQHYDEALVVTIEPDVGMDEPWNQGGCQKATSISR